MATRVAQPLGFFHEVRGEEDRLTALADAAHQVPHRAAGLGVEAGCQLIHENKFGIVDQCQGDMEPLLLPAGKFGDVGIMFLGQPHLFQERPPVHRFAIEAAEQIQGFPHFEAVSQARLLELDADPFAQFRPVAFRVEPQRPDAAAGARAQTLDALNGGGFASPIRPHHAEDFAASHGEADVFDRHRLVVALMKLFDFNCVVHLLPHIFYRHLSILAKERRSCLSTMLKTRTNAVPGLMYGGRETHKD